MPIHGMQFPSLCTNIKIIFLLAVFKILFSWSQPWKNKLRRRLFDCMYKLLSHSYLPQMCSLLRYPKYLTRIKHNPQFKCKHRKSCGDLNIHSSGSKWCLHFRTKKEHVPASQLSCLMQRLGGEGEKNTKVVEA